MVFQRVCVCCAYVPIMLFVLYVCILRECESARVTARLVCGRMRCGAWEDMSWWSM